MGDRRNLTEYYRARFASDMTTETLIAHQWQALPGGGEARIYPAIPRFSGLCSNAFLIETAGALILIDSGGQAEQAAVLADLIRELRRTAPRPLLVLLTHAHFDHFLGLFAQPELLDSLLTVVAVQEDGARALTRADRGLTQAALLEVDLQPLRVDLPLLALGAGGVQGTLNFANGLSLEVTAVWRESGLSIQRLTVDGLALDLIHTPGHSPDHCCLRVGGLVLIGDLLLAAQVAGVIGWDHAALLRSLAGMVEIMGDPGMRVVCPGHGPALPPAAAIAALAAVAEDARPLHMIAELNPGRARWLADFAAVALPEVGRLFLIMAGRLSLVSHLMAEWGVATVEARLQGLIRADQIDQLMEGFSAYRQASLEKRSPQILVALKAGEVVARLQRAFDRDGLDRLLDPSVPRRAERLLADYLLLLRGFAPARTPRAEELATLLAAGLAAHRRPGEVWEDVEGALTAAADFDDWLLARLARRPLRDGVRVTLPVVPQGLRVTVDRERFQDLLTTLLENLVGTGTTDLRLDVESGMVSGMEGQPPAVVIAILAHGRSPGARTAGPAPRPYLPWLAEQAGVRVTSATEPAAGLHGYRIHCRAFAAG